jgi:hypothetical protein
MGFGNLPFGTQPSEVPKGNLLAGIFSAQQLCYFHFPPFQAIFHELLQFLKQGPLIPNLDHLTPNLCKGQW